MSALKYQSRISKMTYEQKKNNSILLSKDLQDQADLKKDRGIQPSTVAIQIYKSLFTISFMSL